MICYMLFHPFGCAEGRAIYFSGENFSGALYFCFQPQLHRQWIPRSRPR